MSIGDERPNYLLNGVTAATRLSDGRIAIGLSRDTQIKYFSASGEHIRTVGGRGRGPGEYEAIRAAVLLPADTLLVLARSPGMTWLGPDGDYLRSLSVDLGGRTRHPCRISERPVFFLAGGRTVMGFDESPGTRGCGALRDGVHRGTTLIEVQDYLRNRFDTLVVLPGTEQNGRDPRVFGARTLLAARGERVYVADSSTDSIRVFEGMHLASVWVTPLDRVAIPDDAKRVRVERRRYSNGREGTREYDYPDWYPRVGRMLVDEVDHLWVMRYPQSRIPLSSAFLATPMDFHVEDGGAHWVVHDPSGHPVARVQTPEGVYPLRIGEDYVLGVAKDTFGAEKVQLHSLVRH